MPTLPDIKTKVTLDASALTSASKTSAVAHQAMQEHAKTSTTHTLKFTDSVKSMAERLGGLPPIVGQVGQSLESMTSTGVTGMGLLGGATLAGAGIVTAVLGESISTYTALAEKVENYKRVTGSSAEESGRMVQTVEALGVSEETATQGMFKLSKAIETHSAKLVADGITVQRSANGNADLAKTLFSVADAYNAELDPARKNLILFDAFGKSGKDMIPILEQGSAGLRNLEEAARITFSDEDLQRAKDYKIQLNELKQGWDAMGESLGQNVVPVLADAMEKMHRTDVVGKRLDEALKSGTLSWGDYQKAALGSETAGNGILKRFNAEYDAAHKAKGALDAMASATSELTRKNEELWTSADKVIGQQEAQASAGFALQLAELQVSESQAKINQAQEAYTAAVKQYGASSDEAALAAGNVTRAQIDQKKELLAVGAAARKLQEDTDLASGTAKNFKLDVLAEIGALQKMADTYAPTSPLRKFLEDTIEEMKAGFPRDVRTTLHIDTLVTAHHAAVDAGYAEGGRPPVGRDIWVGEQGPERVRFDSPATVYSHGTSPTPAPATGGDTMIFNGPLVHAETNADPYDIAVDAAWELRKMRRNF